MDTKNKGHRNQEEETKSKGGRKRLGNIPFQFPISRICMQGYCTRGNCCDLLCGRGWKCQVFEGDLTDENPINLATSVLLYKEMQLHYLCTSSVSIRPIASHSLK